MRPDTRDQFFIIGIAVLASIAGLLNDFVYDDIPIIQDNLRVHSLGNWQAILTRPYWPPPFIEQLYRPFTLLLIAVEYAVGNGSPLIFRLASYALYALSALAFLRFASRILPRAFALGGAALFAAHPVHVEAVALGVSQGELVVGIIAAVMARRYIDARRNGAPSRQEWAILAALYAVASLTKENGFVLPAILLAIEWALLPETPLRARATMLRGGYAALAGVAAVALLVRGLVLAATDFGAVSARAIAGLGLADRLLTMLQVVPMWLRLFAWPVRLQVDYAPHEIATPSTLGASEYAGLALIAAVLAIVILSRRRAPVLCFGVLWCIAGLLPVSNIIPTGILLAERTLFLPSMGFIIAVAAGAEAMLQRWTSPDVKRAFVLAWSVFVLMGIARSTSRHRVWNTAHLVIKRPVTPDAQR